MNWKVLLNSLWMSLTAAYGLVMPLELNSQHLTCCWLNCLWHGSSITYESVLLVPVHVCKRSCLFGSESRLQIVATGKSRSTLSCILKCVTLCLMRRRLIGLRGIGEWQVTDGLRGIRCAYVWVVQFARAWAHARVCALDGVRDTGQRSDMSRRHPVKASWRRVVMQPSGSRTPL